MLTPHSLRDRLLGQVHALLESLVTRCFPNLDLPAYFVGQRVTFMDRADFAWLLIHLHRLGVETITGIPIRDAVRRLLRHIDGQATETFYSYRVAEALLAFGPSFEDNPLLEGLSATERDNLRSAIDTTYIFEADTRKLKAQFPNNYWAVLARCEFCRQQLGVLGDTLILDVALEQLGELLFRSPRGFFDDHQERAGRYDTYSAEVHLFCEPLWLKLDPDRLAANLRAHVRLLEKTMMENGAFLVYGRSVGALSVCMAMELNAVALRLGMAADPSRTLALIDRSCRAFFDEWIADGLISAHRDRSIEGYRGIYRFLQMTLDSLSKVCFVAEQLTDVPAAVAAGITPLPAAELFPAVDEWIPFEDERPAGLWMFRNAHLAFQLACVTGHHSDYVACPRAPGLFENPVESKLICGLPRVRKGADDYSCWGVPESVEKLPGGLRIIHAGFRQTSHSPEEIGPLPGRRVVEYRVSGDTLTVTEQWTFGSESDGVTLNLPEARTPLAMEIIEMPEGAHYSTVAVDGMAEWRSCWGKLRRVHQVNFPPASEIQFSYRVRPCSG